MDLNGALGVRDHPTTSLCTEGRFSDQTTCDSPSRDTPHRVEDVSFALLRLRGQHQPPQFALRQDRECDLDDRVVLDWCLRRRRSGWPHSRCETSMSCASSVLRQMHGSVRSAAQATCSCSVLRDWTRRAFDLLRWVASRTGVCSVGQGESCLCQASRRAFVPATTCCGAVELKGSHQHIGVPQC